MDFPISFELLHSDAVASLHGFRSLVYLVWRDTPTVANIVSLTRAMTSALRSRGADALLAVSLPAHNRLPDSATRAALQQGIERFGVVRGTVNVIHGSGFQAAAMRAVLSGFALVARPKYPVAFVASENEAASFIVNNWSKSDTPIPERAALARALEAVRRESLAAVAT